MPRFQVELQRVKPGPDNTVAVEHGTTEVQADNLEHARELGTNAATDDSSEITWAKQGDGVKSGNGVAHVLSVRSIGPKGGTIHPRHRSPIARGVPQGDEQAQNQLDTTGSLTKRPPGAKPLTPGDQHPRYVNGKEVTEDDDLGDEGDQHGDYASERAEAHPDDTDQWAAQQKANAATAKGTPPNPAPATS